jgi:LmbE family N-acetylglucosaminyl deacetylase
MKRILVVAPHPDDEVLGCGGTLLRHGAAGAELAWLIATGISTAAGWSQAQVDARNDEIAKVTQALRFSRVYNLALPTARLDTLPVADIVQQFSRAFADFLPEEIYVPHPGDAHTDHRIVFDAAAACSKSFRTPSVRRVLAYETISETDFGLDPDRSFRPNCFVDIGQFLTRKLEIMALYRSEMGTFPFPRSMEAIRALAACRGAAAGFVAAEAFQLLRERL